MPEFRQRCKPDFTAFDGLPDWFSALLRSRGIDTEEQACRFLSPSLSGLYDPYLFPDMEKAVGLIRAAISRNEKILIWGDYDADGVCASAILTETLREEGANADYRIPARHTEGYGLNPDGIREIAEQYQLLITVDCGISNEQEILLARKLGMTVIVSDHHEIPETPCPADAVLNPMLGGYPFPRLCGAGVALKICQALQGMAGVEKRLELAALATVADIVPLTDENRIIVREGLSRMEHTVRPGLRALMNTAGVRFPLKSDDFGFRLGPRINAAGRLADAGQAVRLLITQDSAEADSIAAWLEENNRSRQALEREITEQAIQFVRENADPKHDRILVVEGESWNKGLIGLAAGKLCSRYYLPVIVLSREGDTAVGSCRSIPGVHIFRLLSRCSDLLIRFGGHEQAAGLTVSAENIPELRRRLDALVREAYGDSCFIPVEEYDLELPLSQITPETVSWLDQLEPTGCGNPPPVFLLTDASLQEARRVGRIEQVHLKLTLMKDREIRAGIAFFMGDLADCGLRRIDALYCPEMNAYNGQVTVQLRMKCLRPSQEADRSFLALLQEIRTCMEKDTRYIPVSPGEADRLRDAASDDNELRSLYRLIRDGKFESAEELCAASGFSRDRVLIALTAFSDTGLVRWNQEPFLLEAVRNPARCAMTDSPVIRYLREM